MVNRPRNTRSVNIAVGGFTGFMLWLLTVCTSLFVMMLIQAIALRFTVTWGIDIMSWYREVLNNLAGAVGA